jgi:transposase
MFLAWTDTCGMMGQLSRRVSGMRGADLRQSTLFSYVSVEDRIPATHPLRALQKLVNPILTALSPRFDALYATDGRPSIPPERLLRAMLVQVLYTIRSERQLMEQLDYNLLFRWFVGLNPDDAVWVPTVFTKNRERLIDGNIADAFLQEVLKAANAQGLLSHEHFTVDGTLLEAWASQKSFRPKDDPSPPPSDGDPKNPTVDFRGVRRSNATHASGSDPDARLTRKSKGQASTIAHLGSVVMDNRHGLIVATDVRPPAYEAERDAAVELVLTLEPRAQRRTVGADKAYDTPEFVASVRACGATPHVAQNVHATRATSAIDARTTRHAGYAISQRKRKLVEEAFGWGKTIGGLRKLQHRGRAKVGWIFSFTNAAYNLVRMRTLLAAAGGA